jgi:hypothetical protein
MSTRDKRSICLIAVGLLLSAMGLAVKSNLLALAGLFAIAVTVRYRKKPSAWEYLVFLVLALIIARIGPASSPLMVGIPLMVAYFLDYIDEQKRKHGAPADEALEPEPGHAEQQSGRAEIIR